ncbi:hypothetical protein BDR06DRAFT_983114 [Suillus hirtellus]|nr:hypothetical protein BDR06DRAFT_983114 [Suillus hirtellus]
MIRFCQCLNACTPDKQLFEMAMFPASFTRPKTVFTFPVLDGFTLDNLECGTSAMNYYSELRRMTSSIFPHLVPDRYRELMRVAQQWRQLKLLKWNGPTSGELALFCPACLQPGINAPLPADRNPDDPTEQLHPTHPDNEVWLMDGQCFMVSKDQYKAHLAVANNVNKSLHLSIPSGMEIIPGIGLWHVHGHQDKCYVRYASTFITGATRIDSEIMETLWAPLNIISPAVRGMSTPHQQECLDYQINDSNFMKMIHMS